MHQIQKKLLSVVEEDKNYTFWWYDVRIYFSWGRLKNVYGLLNQGALTMATLYKITSFSVWVEYFVWNLKEPLKFHTKYITYTLKVI